MQELLLTQNKKVYFGAFDEKGCRWKCCGYFKIKGVNHKVEVYMGIEEEECTTIE